jgi:hypothetical protein
MTIPTNHIKILKVQEVISPVETLTTQVRDFEIALSSGNMDDVIQKAQILVPEFSHYINV